jgi:hypothetical protein
MRVVVDEAVRGGIALERRGGKMQLSSYREELRKDAAENKG